MTRAADRRARWLLALPVVCAAATYARFFTGFWLGDDFANLHRTWLADRDGDLWAQTWAYFLAPIASGGAFYRPMMIASLSLNEWIAGAHFAGWFAYNYAIHLANVALVGALVATLSAASGRDGRVPGALAAAFFALCPLLAEGVFWISARADASVTLLTLAGFLVWARAEQSWVRAVALPLCLVPALGFKESAAVFPLQMSLMAFAWPSRLSRGRIVGVASCFVVAGLYFGLRAHFFGDPWQVYPPTDADSPPERLWHAVRSIAPWWQGLTAQTPRIATVYAALTAGALVFAAGAARGAHGRLALALACASGGLAVATLLNLGSMGSLGEGGRLTYTSVAWLALALGVALAPAATASEGGEHTPSRRNTGAALLACAVVTGAFVLEGELRTARAAQRDLRALTAAVREWAASHSGLTLLIAPTHRGPVVTARNAHVLVLPPVQREPLLHRILLTLPAEVPTRHEQFSGGLATRLDALRPSQADGDTLRRLLEPDAARWPDHYACWSADRRIVELSAANPADRTRWIDALRDGAERCRVVD